MRPAPPTGSPSTRRLALGSLTATLLLLSGCAGSTASAIPTGPGRFASTSQVETYFSGQTPPRPYEQVGVVKGNYHAATVWGRADVSDVLPELHAKARELGADAVIITGINRYLGPALNPLYRTIPNIDVVAVAIRYLHASATPTPPPPPTLVPGPASLADAVTRVTPSVVRVETSTGSGSGVIVDAGGAVLTAAHVIEGASSIVVVLPNGNRTSATIRARDVDGDVALLGIPAVNLRPASIASSQTLRAGDEIAAIGAPLGLDRTVTKGVVSAIRVLPDGMRLIQTDAAINPGNSGGPVINMRGEVVGVSSFKVVKAEVQGLGFAIAADSALARLGSATLAEPAPVTTPPAPVRTQPVIAPMSVTGTYTGDISGVQAGRGFTMSVTFTVVQQGDRVSATWTTSGGTSGTATGRLNGTEILDFLATQMSPCPGVLRGQVAIEDQGALLRGAYGGDGCGVPVSATFAVTRQ